MTVISSPVRAAPASLVGPKASPAPAPKTTNSALNTASTFAGYVKTPPPPSAYARAVAGMSDQQLRQEAKSLKLQLMLAELPLGAKGNASQLKAKLGVVEGQLHQRQLSGATRFVYERQVGGMSDHQLTAARNHEVVERMTARLRGDAGGVREADVKLGIIDRELSSRKEHGLTQFIDRFTNMGRGEQHDTLRALLNQVTDGMGQGAGFDHVEQAFGQLASVLRLVELAGKDGATPGPAAAKKPPAPSPGEVIGNIFKAIFDPIGFFSSLMK